MLPDNLLIGYDSLHIGTEKYVGTNQIAFVV